MITSIDYQQYCEFLNKYIIEDNASQDPYDYAITDYPQHYHDDWLMWNNDLEWYNHHQQF